MLHKSGYYGGDWDRDSYNKVVPFKVTGEIKIGTKLEVHFRHSSTPIDFYWHFRVYV